VSIVLLDTNVVSFVFKGDTRASDYAPLLQGHQLALSFMTIAELYEWTAQRNWGEKRIIQLEQALTTYLVIPSDAVLCRSRLKIRKHLICKIHHRIFNLERWGILRAAQQAIGKTIAPQDAWIAATALRHGLPLVTHNPSDFQGVAGLEVRSILPLS
jgi:tRNA(fMet)-specific endonuclease VapC